MRLLYTFVLTAALAMAEKTGTFSGVITDSMCGMNHAMMNIKPGTEDDCVRQCVKSGTQFKYVLFDGKNTYKLSNQKAPEQFANQKVLVKGTLYEKTGVIKVDSIQPAK